MTDPLDDLKRAMDAATPPVDAVKKADARAAAEKIFADRQGTVDDARLTPDRPKSTGLIKGVQTMFATLTSRPGLTASTAIVAVGLVAVVPVLREGPPELDDLVLVVPEPIVVKKTEAPATSIRVEPEVQVEPLIMAEEALDAPMIEPAPLLRVAPPAPAGGLSAPDAAFNDAIIATVPTDTEAFANEDQSRLQITTEAPVSTFSIDVDTASYSVVRSSLMNGYLPAPDAVRIEEMVNYFPYAYPSPEAGDGPFRPTVSIAPTPWNPDTQLLHIAIQGVLPPVEDRPPLNLVFLIDTSGSMNQPNKLPLLKQSFRLMLGQLSADDEVSIVTYAGSAGRVLDPTPAGDRATILAALDRLDAGGATAGQQGLEQAYATAEEMTADGEVTRVLLATDGDFNVGLSDPEALEDFISRKRDSGTYLSVLGFGRGNLDDATMQALAQNGNGTAAYIDTLSEAQKVLVDQLTGALFPIANDVKIQVEFNPARIAEYRLIGYETRALAREDFNNDRVDAGEIGAGHRVTAIYEMTPVGSPAVLNDPLRFGQVADGAGAEDALAFLRMRYKEPGTENSQLIELDVTSDMGLATTETRFATAIAGFGELLRNSRYIGDWSYQDAIALGSANLGEDRFGYRREALQLMRLADSLAQ